MKLMKYLLLLLTFVGFAVFAEPDEVDEDGNPVEKSDKVPEWVLTTADGKEVGSKSLDGQAYVLHFWATWCPYCKRLQPGLDSISKDYLERGIKTYAVSFWENPRAKPTREMKNRGLTLPVIEQGDEVAKSFSVPGTPMTIFVSHEGEIVYRYVQSDPNDPQIRIAYETLWDLLKDKDKPKEQPSEETETD